MRHQYFYLTLLMVCLAIVPAVSQESNWPDWTIHANASIIFEIAEEGNFLWLASTTGLVQFNKTTFESKVYTKTTSGIPLIYLRGIAVDKHGTKWMISLDRVISFANNTTWTVYDTNTGPFTSRTIRDIAVDRDNNVVVATDNEVACFANNQWKRYSYDGYPWLSRPAKLYPCSSGGLWFGRDCGGICYGAYKLNTADMTPLYRVEPLLCRRIIDITEGRGRTWFTGEILSMVRPPHYEYSFTWVQDEDTDHDSVEMIVPKFMSPENMSADSNGNIWFSSIYSSQVRRFDGVNWESVNIPAPINGMKDIMTDSEGVVWFAANRGLVRYDGNQWQYFPYLGSLPYDRIPINTLAVDTDNTVWLGFNIPAYTSHFTGTHWIGQYSSTGLSQTLIVDRMSRKWLLDKLGNLFQLQGHAWEIVREGVQCVFADKTGNIWAGINDGVGVYQNSNWTEYTVASSEISGTVTAISQSSDGAMFFATHQGIDRLYDNQWRSYRSKDFSCSLDSVTSLACDSSGNIWIGRPKEVVKFDGNTCEQYRSIEPDFCMNIIPSIVVDRSGDVWIANIQSGDTCSGGVAQYDGTNWQVYDVNNSPLRTNSAISLALDTNNNLWVGTSIDLLVYRKGGVISSIPEVASNSPTPALYQNVPNPTSVHTTFRYSIPDGMAQHICLKVYNMLGGELATLVDRVQQPGEYSFEFDTSMLPVGIYYYQLQAENTIVSKKMLVIR
jgi:streptogramin lyase